MILLDIRTILSNTVLLMIICAGVTWSIWRLNRRHAPGTGFWFANATLQLVAVLLTTLRGFVPVTLSVLLGSPLVIGGALLLLHGLERYVGGRPHPLPGALLFTALIGIHAFFTLITPSLLAQNIALSAALFVVNARSAWVLLRPAAAAAGREIISPVIVFIVYALLSLARIGFDLAADPGDDLFRSGPFDAMMILLYQVLFVSLTVGLLLMVSRRLFRGQGSAMEALRESEARFSLAFRSSPHMLAISRAEDGRLLEVNEAFSALTGYSRMEALAGTSRSLGLWADPGGREAFAATLLAGRRVRNLELQFQAKRGGTLTGLLSAEMISLKGERCIIVGIADITDRKRAEQEAARRAQQHAVVAELGSLALAGADLATMRDQAVRRIAAALDVELAMVLELQADGRTLLLRAGVGWHEGLVGKATVGSGEGSPWETGVMPDLATGSRFQAPALLCDHRVQSGMSVVIGDPSSSLGVLGAYARRHRDFSADEAQFLQTVSHILATAIERHRQDTEIGRLNRLYATLSHVNQTIVRARTQTELFEGTCRVAVEHGGFAAARIGWTDHAGARRATLALRAQNPADRPGVTETEDDCAIATEAARTGRPATCADPRSDPRTAGCRGAAARLGVQSCVAYPLVRHGEVRGTFSICALEPGVPGPAEAGLLAEVSSDIVFALDRLDQEDERRKAETALRESEDRFHQAQKMESVGRLAGGIAHDFNNMLQVILSCATLAEGRTHPTDEVHAYLVQIRTAAERSAELTERLLAFARRQVTAPRLIDLNAAIAGMLEMLRRLIGEDVDIAWMPDPDPSIVRMDPAQVGQVLTNLCVNARDAITGVGRIAISTRRAQVAPESLEGHPGMAAGDYLRLEVTDTGCGMDRATRDRIFEPFFTTKEEGRGTGLGLATVYGIVTQNGGFLDVQSEPGRGTTFSVYLPRHESMEIAPAADAPSEIHRGGGETVLVVEDEPAILELTVEMLSGMGYIVLAAGSPDEAIALAASHAGDIDLLLTDVIMPGMNGLDLTTRLRQSRPRIGCLFMSGYTADVIAHRGVLQSGTNLIQKPFSMTGLAAKVKETLQGRG